MTKLSDVLTLMKSLSKKDMERLRTIVLSDSTIKIDDLEHYTKENRFANGQVCPICGCTHIVRNGHRKDGKQRYICRDCNKSFVINTNSITSGTRKDFDVWKQYIDCMMNGLSIRKSAEICGIHKNTAFIWRHKILDALQNMHKSVALEGIIEADETFFPVSYKGNHSKSTKFIMPRPAHKRGRETHKRGLSEEQVCVPCAVNRNGLSVSKISKLGKVSNAGIEKALGNQIKENSILCTDKEKAYRKFSNEHSLDLIQLDTGKTIKGIYHIQHINNYHSRLKLFLKPFQGVSSKYLNNYLIWNNLVKYSKQTVIEKETIFLSYVLTTPKTVRCRELSDRPPIPLLV